MAIKLHGKDYIEVKDRVQAAHAEESYSMLSEESFEMGGRSYVRVYIDVKGKQYIGTAEIKFNAKGNTPDGMSPFECGETSALGRALGFAGYGVVESIASADEVARNVVENAKPETDDPAIPTVKELQERCAAIFGVSFWQSMVLKALKREEPIRERDLLVEHCVKIAKYLDWAEQQKAAKAGNEQPAA